MKLKTITKKISYSLAANLVSVAASLLVTVAVPKFFANDIAAYGYYQVFVFYVVYIGFLHLGWCDGILLRDAGKEYSSLDKQLYSGQFWLLAAVETIVSIIVAIVGKVFSPDTAYEYIWLLIACNIVLSIPKYMLSYILQATSRIKEYSVLTALGKGIYALTVVIVLLSGVRDFKLFILAWTLGEAISLVTAIIYCRDIVFSKPCNVKSAANEGTNNIKVGIKLLFANIAGLLITGIVRFAVQTGFDIETYGKISFTLTATNMLLTFMSAIELVLFPFLKKKETDELKSIYSNIHKYLMLGLFSCMIVYYPMELILNMWIPSYSDAIRYVAILFPVCVFSSKMSLLVQNYMKVFRMEKQIMLVNVAGVAIAVITAAISVGCLHNLTLAMTAIVFNHMFRCIMAEILLGKAAGIEVSRDIILETVMAVAFITTMWFIGGWAGTAVYVAVFAGYCFITLKKKSLDNYA